jgi:hypothetical protein
MCVTISCLERLINKNDGVKCVRWRILDVGECFYDRHTVDCGHSAIAVESIDAMAE